MQEINFDGRLFSFIEDRDRSTSVRGHTLLRLSEFSPLQVNTTDIETLKNTEVELTSAVFVKHSDSNDSNVLDKTFIGVKRCSTRSFVMCTGGTTMKSILRYIQLEKYEECTNQENVLITL